MISLYFSAKSYSRRNYAKILDWTFLKQDGKGIIFSRKKIRERDKIVSLISGPVI